MFNPFSQLTSKIFAGTTVALALALGAVIVLKNHDIRSLEFALDAKNDEIVALKLDNATLKANQSELEKGVAQCSASVAVAAAKANEAAAAGTAALNEARRNSGRVASAVEAIQAMPAASCADAEAILRAGAGQ